MKLRASYIEAIIWQDLNSETVRTLDGGDFVIIAEVSQQSGRLLETSTGIVNNTSTARLKWRLDYEWTEGAGGNCFLDSSDVRHALEEGRVYMFAILQKSSID